MPYADICEMGCDDTWKGEIVRFVCKHAVEYCGTIKSVNSDHPRICPSQMMLNSTGGRMWKAG